MAASDDDRSADERIIAEEYKIWKKNCPYLYDSVITHALDWPSLTVDWIDSKVDVADKDYSEHKLILGTHTNKAEPNYLMVATVRLPREDAEIDATKYDEDKGELGGYGGLTPKFEVICRMVHDGEVNRARHCPHEPFVIATKGPTGDVFLYDYSAHPSRPRDDSEEAKPQMRLTGHTREGYGLAWCPTHKGRVLSGSDDSAVLVWDTEGASGASMPPTAAFHGHESVVEDVAWGGVTDTFFGSVGDDRRMVLWDFRQQHPIATVLAHDSEVNCLDFNPFMPHLIATGGADRAIALWDTRNLSGRLHTLDAHTDEVFAVQWAPFNESILASSAQDRRLAVWDLSRIGREQTPEDARDGPPELLFIHGGHTGKISDFQWNLRDDWYVASVAEDNVLQVWQMAESIYLEKDDAESSQDEIETSTSASSSSNAA